MKAKEKGGKGRTEEKGGEEKVMIKGREFKSGVRLRRVQRAAYAPGRTCPGGLDWRGSSVFYLFIVGLLLFFSLSACSFLPFLSSSLERSFSSHSLTLSFCFLCFLIRS